MVEERQSWQQAADAASVSAAPTAETVRVSSVDSLSVVRLADYLSVAKTRHALVLLL